jgi:hypothetical protein
MLRNPIENHQEKKKASEIYSQQTKYIYVHNPCQSGCFTFTVFSLECWFGMFRKTWNKTCFFSQINYNLIHNPITNIYIRQKVSMSIFFNLQAMK